MQLKILTTESDKQALLDQLSGAGYALMFFYDEAPDNNVPHEKIAPAITLIQPPYSYARLEKWLRLGNWQAIFPGNKDYKPFDTFKTPAHDIETRMKEAGVKLIIDSFHDNIEWNVIT